MKRARRERGYALVVTLVVMAVLGLLAASSLNQGVQSIRTTRRQLLDVQTTHFCEAGIQSVLRQLWRSFRTTQLFETDLDPWCNGASETNPAVALDGELPESGRYAAGVIRYSTPNGDPYRRRITVRSVGFIDKNGNGYPDPSEPQKIVDATAEFMLSRSQVFDYVYFVNNYGWMDGFGANDLVVNGDMRANGDFDFTNGFPTVNGSVLAAGNVKLTNHPQGKINSPPVKNTNSTYRSSASSQRAWRQGYSSSVHGAPGSAQFEEWRELIFNSDAVVANNKPAGAVLGDADGTRSWQRTAGNQTPVTQLLDPAPTEEVVMPDLSDLNRYMALSSSFVNTKASFGDGTPNPDFGRGAYVEVWDPTLNSGNGAYRRVDTNGIVNGSAVLIGTSTRPIKVHGPVTFTQDCVIKGTIQGQGTIYTGRNTHIIGSLRYANPPDFRGSNLAAVDNANEKRDILGLAARGSVILGNPKRFTHGSPLRYMTPPWTQGRYDDNGNWIPPYNALDRDATGFMRYQSVMGDDYLDSLAEGVNQVDAILYTNFVGGGNIGTGGGGCTFNGALISKDEAMVVFSKPMRMNYDTRIKERRATAKPLIDIQLPRSPAMMRNSWQDRGFRYLESN